MAKIKIIDCLKKLKVDEYVINKLVKLDFTKAQVFIDGEEPYKIDFMTQISGVKFDDAWQQKIISHLDGLDIPFIHLNHLIISKITTNRTQDKIDVEQLQRIQNLKR